MSLPLLFDHLDDLIRTPEDVARLDEALLDMAMSGRLVMQQDSDKLNGGGLSADWKQATLGEVVLEVQTGPFGSMLHKSDYVENGIPVVNPANIQSDRIVPIATMAVSEATKQRLERHILMEGDIVMARRGEMGRCAIVTRKEAGWLCGSGSFVLKPSPRIDPEYLVRVIRSPSGRRHLAGGSVGSTMNNLNHRVLTSLPLLLPPLPEQRRIVAKVDELLAQTRALAANLRRAQGEIVTANQAALHRLASAEDGASLQAAWHTLAGSFDLLYDDPRPLAALRQAILQLAVRGKLVRQEEGDEPAEELVRRISLEHGEQSFMHSVIKVQDTEFPLPSTWMWVRFSGVATIATNGVDPANYGDLPHIAPDNIEKLTGRLMEYRTVREDGVTSVKHYFRPGHILYSKIRPNLSKVVLVDFEGLCSADMYPIASQIDRRYLHFYMLSDTFRSLTTVNDTRVAMPKINQNALARVPVPVPPLAEQRRIVAKVDELLAMCDALEGRLGQAAAVQRAALEAVLARV